MSCDLHHVTQEEPSLNRDIGQKLPLVRLQFVSHDMAEEGCWRHPKCIEKTKTCLSAKPFTKKRKLLVVCKKKDW